MAKQTDGHAEHEGREFPVILNVEIGGETFRLTTTTTLSMEEMADALTAVAGGKSLDSILAQHWAATQGNNLQRVGKAATSGTTGGHGRTRGGSASHGTYSDGTPREWSNAQRNLVDTSQVPYYGGKGRKSAERQLWEAAVEYEGKVSVPEAEANGQVFNPPNSVPWGTQALLAK